MRLSINCYRRVSHNYLLSFVWKTVSKRTNFLGWFPRTNKCSERFFLVCRSASWQISNLITHSTHATVSFSFVQINRSIELNLHARCYWAVRITSQWRRAYGKTCQLKVTDHDLKLNVKFSTTYIITKLAFVQQNFFSYKMCTKTEGGKFSQWFCQLPICANYSVNILQSIKMHFLLPFWSRLWPLRCIYPPRRIYYENSAGTFVIWSIEFLFLFAKPYFLIDPFYYWASLLSSKCETWPIRKPCKTSPSILPLPCWANRFIIPALLCMNFSPSTWH